MREDTLIPKRHTIPARPFFFQEVSRIENEFASQIKAIPSTPRQKQTEELYKLSGVHRLEKFGDFVIIDNLVKTYGGAYTHDNIFDMDVVLVHNMILLNKMNAYIESRKADAEQDILKAKK